MHERQGDAQAGRVLQKRAPVYAPCDERIHYGILYRSKLHPGGVEQFGAIIAS
jgi:hypothetical protein